MEHISWSIPSYSLYNASWHFREIGTDLPLFAAQRAVSQQDARLTQYPS